MTQSTNDTVKYIIVVHGIGEQRKNETVLSVVNRLAQVRRNQTKENIKESDHLTLGRATGQTGRDHFLDPCRHNNQATSFIPWMEFEGIGQTPPSDPSQLDPFYGIRSTSGNNLRFVDLCWSDIMQKDWPHVGQKVEDWAQSLLGRLKDRQKAEPAKVPVWVTEVLNHLANTLIFARKALSFRFKKLEEMIFAKFLGDVQLYGEYPRVRGQAVRRFHKLMNLIETRHKEEEKKLVKNNIISKEREARYTVIAHSLGTVMSMDALFYALVKEEIRDGSQTLPDIPELPFPEYCEKDSNTGQVPAYIHTDWIKRVDSFVTLGSPIDKFLVMFWLNYRYLDHPELWCEDQQFVPDQEGGTFFASDNGGGNLKKVSIKHYNYCDEQDPVGHHLDLARNRVSAFRGLFDSREDIVFNRYPVPGAAHVGYWNDLELFQHITGRAIDNKQDPQKLAWFKPSVYKKAMNINYSVVPLLIVLADFFTLTWVLYAENKQAVILATLVFVGTCYLGRKVIDLMIYWRRIQIHLAHRKTVNGETTDTQPRSKPEKRESKDTSYDPKQEHCSCHVITPREAAKQMDREAKSNDEKLDGGPVVEGLKKIHFLKSRGNFLWRTIIVPTIFLVASVVFLGILILKIQWLHSLDPATATAEQKEMLTLWLPLCANLESNLIVGAGTLVAMGILGFFLPGFRMSGKSIKEVGILTMIFGVTFLLAWFICTSWNFVPEWDLNIIINATALVLVGLAVYSYRALRYFASKYWGGLQKPSSQRNDTETDSTEGEPSTAPTTTS